MSYTNGLDNPELYFQVKIYTGTGSSQAHTFDGAYGNMQPDFLWFKRRGSGAASHGLFNVITGVTKLLKSNDTDEEKTVSSELSSFDSNGFTLGSGGDGYTNQNSGKNYVAWAWKAGGSASSNSNGSITSSVSANTTAGFSIVSFTGTGSTATIGHGLGAVPAWIITKGRSNAGNNWAVYHHKNTSAPETDYLLLNATNSTGDNAGYWNDTAPTSSVYTVGAQVDTNKASEAMIAYCWAEVKGFSKFGSYLGNGDADGPFIYTGFKPAFFLVKRTTGTAKSWIIHDNKRDPNNLVDAYLYPNSSEAEGTSSSSGVDFLSNGIKLRNTYGSENVSGETFVYAAFAQNPIVTSSGSVATAR